MPYAFKAYTEDRKVVEGIIDAVSENAAEQSLYESGYQRILSLEERPAGTFMERHLPGLAGVKNQDVIEFSREMATLVHSGVTVLAALELLQGQVQKASLRTVITGMIKQIGDGKPFSEAAGRYPHIFPYTYCQVVRAAEQAGNLEAGLNQMTNYMDKQAAMNKKIISAVTYPGLVIGMAIAIVVVLMVVAMPPLINLFTTLNVELPLQTKILIGFGNFITEYKFQIAAATLLIAVAAVGFLRMPAGKLAMSHSIINTPGIGPLAIQRNLGQFSRSASMLLRAGLRLPDIMEIVSRTIPNLLVRRSFEHVGSEILQGQSLSKVMAADRMFPPMMVGMVAVGEKTGDLEGAFESVAEYYERSVDQRIARMIALIEPVMTIVVGLGVAFIVLSLITPLYSVMRSLSAG